MGFLYFRRRGIERDNHFSTEQFMHLWMNGWVYTGERPGSAPGPVIIGDRDVSQDLRDAIQEFHSSLRNGQWATAWQFVSTLGNLKSLIQKDIFEVIEARQLKAFEDKMTGPSGPRLQSWRPLDIRTVVSSIEYVATIEIKGGFATDGVAAQPVEWNETWLHTSAGWSIKWDGFPF